MAEILTADHATQAGHWYQKDGTPAYTIIGKNGKERPTTLRDARKLGLVPSVTTVIGCASSPALTNWKIDQAILSALTLGRLEEETEKEYLDRIKADAQEQAKKAAERGTQIHAWVQQWFEGAEIIPALQGGYEFIQSAHETIHSTLGHQNWICEKPFAADKYGGKCDLHNEQYLLDIKTKDKFTDLKLWESHYMQLAAYRAGLPYINTVQCGILWINSVTAESRLVWAEEKDLDKGWKMFSALLDYFYAKTGLEV